MKKITSFFAGLICFYLSYAQTNIERETSKIVKLIERNVSPGNEKKPYRSYEYCMYDISLDSNGLISNIDLLRLDSSIQIDAVRNIIPLIIKSWTPVKSSITKIIIPILIINGNVPENGIYDTSALETNTLFEMLHKKQIYSKIFISRTAVIVSYESATKVAKGRVGN